VGGIRPLLVDDRTVYHPTGMLRISLRSPAVCRNRSARWLIDEVCLLGY